MGDEFAISSVDSFDTLSAACATAVICAECVSGSNCPGGKAPTTAMGYRAASTEPCRAYQRACQSAWSRVMTIVRIALIALIFDATCGQLVAQETPAPVRTDIAADRGPAGRRRQLHRRLQQPSVLRQQRRQHTVERAGPVRSFNQRVGSYNQPAWTTQRPFASTRTYVLPAGVCEFEQWARPTWNEGDEAEWRMLEEVSIGLPHRIQLDLYERWNIEPDDDGNKQANHEGVQIEMRYALADWDVIPLNPTLYLEWIERGGPQEESPTSGKRSCCWPTS